MARTSVAGREPGDKAVFIQVQSRYNRILDTGQDWFLFTIDRTPRCVFLDSTHGCPRSRAKTVRTEE
jgi:hypothetical protein